MKYKINLITTLLQVSFLLIVTVPKTLLSQTDTIYYFDFESTQTKIDSQNKVKFIIDQACVFKDAEPYLTIGGTVSNASPYSYRTIEYGDYIVGKSYLYHSPSWYLKRYEGRSYNQIELHLNKPLDSNNFYLISFLIGNMKSHRYKMSHYGIKFSNSKIAKEKEGGLMSNPDLLFPFSNDLELQEIQGVVFMDYAINYIYFGSFEEDSIIVSKQTMKFVSEETEYADSIMQLHEVMPTRVILDNILIKRISKLDVTFKDIYFDSNEDQVKLSEDKITIDSIAKYLNENPTLHLLIQGFTDRLGSVQYNFALSERRANSIKEMLRQKQVPVERIITLGQGVYSNDNPIKNNRYARKVSFLFFK